MVPQILHRQLRQELDWIVMKALEKDRGRRYAAAIALAEDIQHYLAHEPVHAGPPGNWYRVRKFVRRFRVPLSVAAGFVALLVVITILAVRGYYREATLRSDTEAARIRAENEAEKAKNNFKMARDAVQKYYTQVAKDPRLKPHNLERLRRDLLESANEYYEKLTSQEADDPDLQHEQVSALIARGAIERDIGNWSEAVTAYNKALATATRLTQIDVAEAQNQSDLAIIHGGLGRVYKEIGRTKEAEAAYKEALAIGKILVKKHSEVPEYQSQLSTAHGGLAVLYTCARRTKEAEAAYKESLAIGKILAEKHPGVPEYQHDLANSHSNLGYLYSGYRPGQGSGSRLQGSHRHSENPRGKASRRARVSA